ncbi:YheV family putative zinc ribbon protein [Larsenimonas suaedae]|uniref:YheV family putative zinc ribbon protein n=1 Tax=Larsenimonas suaedae TaxID=1851019 RepID=A0ABU1GQY6_9GAMM|nr:YheV family putative zinc ribbon protein [Larsenimonas suaedae]MCM2972746.1 YheV family putative metal-binding protein [Larsenimonas suaedae]MDR5894457.1 YheV family putative zinc ribbon protein [Larsenimonas suaedae]
MSTPKRFIAGAICPRCAEMDRVRAWESQGVRYRECVSCDFFEQLPIEEQPGNDEIETRVNRPRDTEQNNDIQTVKIITPSSKS